jgi:hypothetical protein
MFRFEFGLGFSVLGPLLAENFPTAGARDARRKVQLPNALSAPFNNSGRND